MIIQFPCWTGNLHLCFYVFVTNETYFMFVDRHQNALCGDGARADSHSSSWFSRVLVHLEIPGIFDLQLYF